MGGPSCRNELIGLGSRGENDRIRLDAFLSCEKFTFGFVAFVTGYYK